MLNNILVYFMNKQFESMKILNVEKLSFYLLDILHVSYRNGKGYYGGNIILRNDNALQIKWN